MQFKPYTGPQHMLYTHLSADECLRRLRDEVITPWFGSKRTGRQPFKRDRMASRDQLVYRKVKGQRFEMLLDGAHSSVRGLQWTFQGEVVHDNNGVHIVGRYRTDRWGMFSWYANLGVAILFLVFGLIFGVVNIYLSASVWDIGAPFVIALLGGCIILWPTNNAPYQRDEAYIIESLKKLLDAEEVPSS